MEEMFVIEVVAIFQRLFDKDVFVNIAKVSFPISNPTFVCLVRLVAV